MGLASLLAALLAATDVVPVSDGNALTLPAARHLVRLDPQQAGRPATWLLAVQQDGSGGHALGFWRSDDEAQSWSYYAPIQDDASERDTADIIVVGMDLAVVYSYEGPTISGSAAHDVYFQWWRWNGAADWIPSSPVRVFDSTSNSTAYLRGELARDSLGRLWIWAQRLNADGTFTGVMSVSANQGASFQEQPSLDSFSNRPGGRILAVGGARMMLLYSTHGVDPGYMRLRNDSDPVGSWTSPTVVFSEGIYHGAALSAADDGNGGVHLAYKDVNEQLLYRHWNGSSWSGAQTIDGASDWALQPAVTRVGADVLVFFNHVINTNTDYRFRYVLLRGGSFSGQQSLDDSGGFKGYPASVEVLPNTVPEVPCFYGRTPDANSGGAVAITAAPTPDPGTSGGDGGTDGGVPDGGTGGGGGTGGVLFSDNFDRNASTLGSAWRVDTGAWIDDSRANTDRDATDQASVAGLSCADCSVQARVVGFGDATLALDLRQTASNDRYDLALLTSGHLQIRRHNGSTTTVLADAASGIADLTDWATLALSATGAGPVQLTASVNGAVKLSATDSSASAIKGPGTAGIWANLSGTWFDDFVVSGTGGGGGGGSDGGVADAGGGVPDAGAPDSGVLDAGTPDAGTPDAGAPDAGGDGDGGTVTTGVLFTDDFNRSLGSSLGPKWNIVAGAWMDDQRANSDLDALDRATAAGVTCADCRIDARLVGFGDGEAMLELRVSGTTRYALALMTNGNLALRRYVNGAATTLGTAPSGIADLSNWASVSFGVSGTAPVTLTGYVNGAAKLTATDSSTAALKNAGAAGIAATISGVWIDDFTLTGMGAVSGGGGEAPDGGVSDAGSGTPDAGSGTPPDAGTPDGGSGIHLSSQVTYTGTEYDILAVDPAGTAYAVNLDDSGWNLYASTDGRAFSFRGIGAGYFWTMTALSDGVLLADVINSNGDHALSRSTSHGASWTQTLVTGVYRTVTPHSFGELDGAVYYLEYQVFTGASTPIRLWKSTDRGASWFVQSTFQGHRHGHGLAADPARHALWAWFGDTDDQSGAYRSTDGGATWTLIAPTQFGGIVDGAVLSDGSVLCGQDITYQPWYPHIARLGLNGSETDYVQLPSPSYSTHIISGGGYVVGVTRENGGDIYPPGYTSGALWGSGDGTHWSELLEVPRLSDQDDVRTDVYWELNTGELVVNVKDAAGFHPGGRGYLLIRTTRF